MNTELIMALIPMLMIAVIFWAISVARKDVSIVDSLWSIFIVIAPTYLYFQYEDISQRSQLVLLLAWIWALRLSLYITIRHWGHEEDHRYQVIRQNNNPGFAVKSLYLIFIFQAVVAWVVALPLLLVFNTDSQLGWLDMFGVILWVTGMYFESVSDYQLWKFKRNPENRGKVLTTGLWKYTRHPNYFGEFLVWWGFFSFAISAGQPLAIVSPLLMTFLLLKFSGVAMLEKTMKVRPGYEDYMKNTNAFIPGFARGKGV